MIRSILFIKRVINRKIDINKNKEIIILALNILNHFINFKLNIKFDGALKGTRIRIKFNKLLIRKLIISLIIITCFL